MERSKYLKRVPSQHRDKPKFAETLRTVLDPLCALGALMESVPELYDLDSAVGAQLDAVGAWVGRTRWIDSPLTGIYFEWKGTLDTGWNHGLWKGRYDPTSGLVKLDDDTFRTLIRLQIAANSWDGTTEGAYSAWKGAFPQSQIIIEDHQDMTITIGIAGKMQGTSQKALFAQQISPFKPGGVRIDVYFIGTTDAPLFSWNLETDAMQGWGVGAWAQKFTIGE